MTAPLPLEARVLHRVWLVNGSRAGGLRFNVPAHPTELINALNGLVARGLLCWDAAVPDGKYLPAYVQYEQAAQWYAAQGGAQTELFAQRYARHVCQTLGFTLLETIPLAASLQPDGSLTDTASNYLGEVSATSALREDLPDLFDNEHFSDTGPQTEGRLAALVRGGLSGWLLGANFLVHAPGTLPFQYAEAYGESFMQAFDRVAARVQQHRADSAQGAT